MNKIITKREKSQKRIETYHDMIVIKKEVLRMMVPIVHLAIIYNQTRIIIAEANKHLEKINTITKKRIIEY